jgi:hypothetical protein
MADMSFMTDAAIRARRRAVLSHVSAPRAVMAITGTNPARVLRAAGRAIVEIT